VPRQQSGDHAGVGVDALPYDPVTADRMADVLAGKAAIDRPILRLDSQSGTMPDQHQPLLGRFRFSARQDLFGLLREAVATLFLDGLNSGSLSLAETAPGH
jgi:hypothetical protein